MSAVVQIQPGARLRGTAWPPGDKSISHRLALVAGLSAGRSRLDGFLAGEDCLHTAKALRALGVGAEMDGATLVIEGGAWRQPGQPLDLGNSGTGLRLLAGLLAGRPLAVELTGDASLCSRPMRRIQEPLQRMGAAVELLGPGGRPPVRVRGGRLRGIEYDIPVASAQVKSCILLAALFAEGTTVVREPQATRDHTEHLFRILGLPLETDGRRLALRGSGPAGPALRGRDWQVPGDFSSAAFWLAGAAAGPDSLVSVEGVGLNPRRTALLDVLRRMGASLEVTPADQGASPEPLGRITVRGGALRGTRVAGAEIPNLIDELPVVAALGALAVGATEIREARELRVKECDRIAALAANLQIMGVEVREHEDGLTIRGGGRLRGGVALDSRGDHRVAMALAVLALFAERPVTIAPVDCVSTSYPGFWRQLEALGGQVVFHRGG